MRLQFLVDFEFMPSRTNPFDITRESTLPLSPFKGTFVVTYNAKIIARCKDYHALLIYLSGDIDHSSHRGAT